MIIDTHAHIFPNKIAHKAVDSIGDFYNLSMHGGVGMLDDLIEKGTQSKVDLFIVNSSATIRAQVEAINIFIVDSIKDKDNVLGLCTLHPDMTGEDIDYAIAFAKANGLIGVKLHPDFQKFYIDDINAYKIYERCEGNLPILFHAGDSRYEFSAPRRLAKIAKEFPKLQCIAAHFGGYERWDEVDCYIDTPNVHFDTSSSLYKLSVERALAIIKMLGADRFMYGVDYPMWGHAEELERFNRLNLSDSERDAILFLNALKFYNIDKQTKII